MLLSYNAFLQIQIKNKYRKKQINSIIVCNFLIYFYCLVK